MVQAVTFNFGSLFFFLFAVLDPENRAVSKIHMALVSCSLQYKENTDGKNEKINS